MKWGGNTQSKKWRTAVSWPNTVLQRETAKCVLSVLPDARPGTFDWADNKGPASWEATCSGGSLDAASVRLRGRAQTLSAAKAAASRAAKKLEHTRRADANEIEAIAKDAEKQARGLRKFDPEKANKLRADARRLRAQMFEGARKRR